MAFKRRWAGCILLHTALLCGVAISMSRGREADQEPPDAEAEAALNRIAIGCNDLGAAVAFLINREVQSQHIQYKGGTPVRQLGELPEDMANEFDYVQVFSNQRPDTFYLIYSKDSFVVAKCRRNMKSPGSPTEIYRQEIMSGNQHLPRRPGIAEKIQWGELADIKEEALDNNPQPVDEAGHRRLRCGIVWTDPIGPRGYNLFVLIRNDDTNDFQDNLYAEYTILGTVNRVAIQDLTTDDELAVVLPTVMGSQYEKVPGQKDKLRFASVRLRPGESMFFGFNVAKNPKRKSIAAKARLYGADEMGTREYHMTSGAVSGAG